MLDVIWTEEIIKKLEYIKEQGFIGIPEVDFRSDDGVVGQVLERAFGVSENNLRIGDLGIFELKAMRNRKNKSNLTLGHQKPTEGMSTRQLFEKYGYIKESTRNPGIMKKKLFTTIKGSRYNNRGFILKVRDGNDGIIDLYHKTDGYLSTWVLDLKKVENMVLVFADTEGKPNARDEKFHFVEGYLYKNMNSLNNLVNDGYLVMDLCIDQPVDGSKTMHDRGPHWRISTKQLPKLYKEVHQLLS
ncbi:hypothetical protein SC09_Contig28orf00229 [Bacillus subtilis]|uniref:MvaI/BcnI restriction endonuclease domain-containing protein n=1 Tax=Bacillus subtilis TaxID=1423 RepID=A0A0D1ILU7_BACIU|nr:hypothetical protein SC09_Contig28orf00229 [Bacillus subtilis]